jgi:hypothetical protein
LDWGEKPSIRVLVGVARLRMMAQVVAANVFARGDF